MMRFVPPAGSPLRMRKIMRSVSTAPSNGQTRLRLQGIADNLGVKHALGMSSGRAALWLALKSLHRLRPERNVVAIPAYTCFSVAAAVVRAGLTIRLIEIDPSTLDFDPSAMEKFDGRNLLCIVPCNLFGLPNAMAPVLRAARAAGAYVVDDAAQGVGSTRDGKSAGTFGDVGIYSLGRGKSLASVAGGLLVTESDEIAAAAEAECRSTADNPLTSSGELVAKMFTYSLLLHPRLFWVPNSLPFLKLGTTEFDPNFPVGEIHPISLALAADLLNGVNDVNRIRQANARAVADALDGNNDFACPSVPAGAQPTFVRLPIIARDAATRDRAVERLRAGGIGATKFYPSAICDIPGIDAHRADAGVHCREAENLSRRLFTVPVHPYVQRSDIERITRILTAA